MPMIDVYAHSAPALGSELICAVLRAEGVTSPGPFHLNNTAARYPDWLNRGAWCALECCDCREAVT